MRFEFQEGIGMAIRKEVLHRRGALRQSATRAPAAALGLTMREALDGVDRVLARPRRRPPERRPGAPDSNGARSTWISG